MEVSSEWFCRIQYQNHYTTGNFIFLPVVSVFDRKILYKDFIKNKKDVFEEPIVSFWTGYPFLAAVFLALISLRLDKTAGLWYKRRREIF